MTQPMIEPEPATLEKRATALISISTDPDGRHILTEDGPKGRMFLATRARIEYAQDRVDPDGPDEVIPPWDVTVTVLGPVITSGSAGRRETRATYRQDMEVQNIPDWLKDDVERFRKML